MGLLTRRRFLQSAGGVAASTTGLMSYALAIEPGWRLGVTRYALTPTGWPAALSLKVGVIADIHACRPLMGPEHIRTIAALTNAQKPDIIVILGDYNGAHHFVTGPVLPEEWAAELAALRAPLGVYSVLGNHDFWHGPLPHMKGDEGESVRRALKSANIRLLENEAVRIATPYGAFWLGGLGDQMANHWSRGVFVSAVSERTRVRVTIFQLGDSSTSDAMTTRRRGGASDVPHAALTAPLSGGLYQPRP